MKKITIFCAPGFKKKSGYYFRCLRDAENFRLLGCEVEVYVFSLFSKVILDNESRAKSITLFSLFKNKIIKSNVFIGENISMVLPLILVKLFADKSAKYGFVYHGSLDELRYDKFGKFKYFIYKKFEIIADYFLDFVLLVSESFSKVLKDRNTLKNIEHFITPNLPDEKFFSALEQAKNNLVRDEERIIVTYVGNAQAWQNIDYIVILFHELTKRNKKFFFQILTLDVEIIKSKLKLVGISTDNYVILSVSNEDVPKYLISSDCLIVIRDINETNQVSCPTKAIEYIYSGSKLIVSDKLGDISSLVVKYNLGLVLTENKKFDFDYLEQEFIRLKNSPKNKVFIPEINKEEVQKIYESIIC